MIIIIFYSKFEGELEFIRIDIKGSVFNYYCVINVFLYVDDMLYL